MSKFIKLVLAILIVALVTMTIRMSIDLKPVVFISNGYGYPIGFCTDTYGVFDHKHEQFNATAKHWNTNSSDYQQVVVSAELTPEEMKQIELLFIKEVK